MFTGSQQDGNHLVGLIPSGFDRRGLTRNVRKHNDKGLSPTSEHAAAHQEAGV
jgi:hypothetical protein